MAKFDLSKTQEVDALFATPHEQRDQNWKRQFYEAIVDASMATTPTQVMQGPDGFRYFVLNIPPAGQPFEPFCISHITAVCLEHGFGVAIQPEPGPPQWVFTYGQLWSLKELGKFDVDKPAETTIYAKENSTNRNIRIPAGQTVFVGQPSESFLPPYARKAIKEFLARRGVSHPGVLLVQDPKMGNKGCLAFSIFEDEFKTKRQFDNLIYRLNWYLPDPYGLLVIGRGSELLRGCEPL